jgi:hypothetical protein
VLAAETTTAVPWWQWALFVPAGVGLSVLWWHRRNAPTLWRPAWVWRATAIVCAVVIGPATALFGVAATIWTLVAQPGG